jgi:hypothetical protein
MRCQAFIVSILLFECNHDIQAKEDIFRIFFDPNNDILSQIL